jgi:hypothetical protein
MKRVMLARLAVDSGMLRIGDPCYEMPYDAEVGEKGTLDHLGTVFGYPVSQAFDFPTVFGDGIYNVFGMYKDDIMVSVVIELEPNL